MYRSMDLEFVTDVLGQPIDPISMGRAETETTNLRALNIAEERRSHLHSGGAPKSRSKQSRLHAFYILLTVYKFICMVSGYKGLSSFLVLAFKDRNA
jgi:hypothetical protein